LKRRRRIIVGIHSLWKTESGKKKKKRPWTYQKYNKTLKQKQLRFSLGFSFPANITFPEKESGDVREDRVAGKASTEREQLGG